MLREVFADHDGSRTGTAAIAGGDVEGEHADRLARKGAMPDMPGASVALLRSRGAGARRLSNYEIVSCL